MSAIRPKFVAVEPDEVELHGAAAALVLAHIRYRCDSDGPGRFDIDGYRWWRVSVADLAHEVGLSIQSVRTALKALSGLVEKQSFSDSSDTTKAYRPNADLPFVAANKPQVTTDPVCCQQQDPLLAATNAPLLETTREQNTSCSEPLNSESSWLADDPVASRPGVFDDEQTPQGEEPMKHDPDQNSIPGLHLLPVPKSDVPAVAKSRGTRLPVDWTPPPYVIAQMREECPNVDQQREFLKFRDYWLEKTGKDCTKMTWVGTYRNWIRKADSDYQRGRRPNTSTVDAKVIGWLTMPLQGDDGQEVR